MTDDEYVERIRRVIPVLERLRRRLLVLYSLGLVVVVGLFIAAIGLLRGLNFQGIGPGFVLGLMLGVMLGGLALKGVHGFLTALQGYRSEHLMLRYYDALQERQGKQGTREPTV